MRLLAGLRTDGPLTLAEHQAIHGPLPRAGRELIDVVEAAGLRGRGGANFPAAIKLRAVAERRRPVVVINGTEGEPRSSKDALLLMRVPHLVIDGAELAAAAVGAREVILAAPTRTHAVLTDALAERRSPVTLAASAAGYVAGEETAVIAHLEGKPPLPRVTPPRPAERGLRKRPTLVQNVETLAHLALIARHGAEWFRAAGTERRTGTTLLTVSGAAASGVLESEAGATLGDVLDPSEPLRAVLVGGYFGGWVPAEESRALDGAALGAGVIHALGRSSCPIAETARIATYMASQSAGQCGPCVFGLSALAGVLERLAAGHGGRDDAARLARWTEMVRGRGACAHPDGVARLLASATQVFAEELDDHVHRGACVACARVAVAA
jgi:NADH:ubiquinone oxidoreductase subunit F (NADH-binding)